MDKDSQPQDQISSQEAAPQQESASLTSSSKKSKKHFIVKIIGVALLIGVVVALVLIAMPHLKPDRINHQNPPEQNKATYGPPSENKVDYEEAHAQVFKLKEIREDDLRQIPDRYVTIDEYKESVKKFKKEFNDLGKMKAAINDKDVKKAYGKAQKKLVAYSHYLDVYVEEYEKIMPIIDQYAGMGIIPHTGDEYREKARKYEVIVSDLKSQTHKEFVEDVIKNTKAMAEACDKMKLCNSSENVDDSSVAATQFSILQSRERVIAEKWNDGLDEIRKNGEITKDLNALESLLAKKAKEAK